MFSIYFWTLYQKWKYQKTFVTSPTGLFCFYKTENSGRLAFLIIYSFWDNQRREPLLEKWARKNCFFFLSFDFVEIWFTKLKYNTTTVTSSSLQIIVCTYNSLLRGIAKSHATFASYLKYKRKDFIHVECTQYRILDYSPNG
jgi:hypothetical protein